MRRWLPEPLPSMIVLQLHHIFDMPLLGIVFWYERARMLVLLVSPSSIVPFVFISSTPLRLYFIPLKLRSSFGLFYLFKHNIVHKGAESHLCLQSLYLPRLLGELDQELVDGFDLAPLNFLGLGFLLLGRSVCLLCFFGNFPPKFPCPASFTSATSIRRGAISAARTVLHSLHRAYLEYSPNPALECSSVRVPALALDQLS
ncbi:uncharacterized protein G2W53_003723 [Senna tora]|uniref:Uncharacterized protein n=1 Tax=Senna tora TaxID=362788 RepID=A0A835CIP0_9FABA|nr:uncharacterized protein G2W53_003723 [Senna tora]